MNKKSTNHCDNIEEIIDIINQFKFMNLINYTEFNWLLLGHNNIIKIMKSDDMSLIKYLIDNTFNLEKEINNKMQPIHYACRFGSIEIVKLLVEKNVDLEAETINKTRPIHYACRFGSIEMVKLLVEKNVDLDAKIDNNNTPFI